MSDYLPDGDARGKAPRVLLIKGALCIQHLLLQGSNIRLLKGRSLCDRRRGRG
jgi:hypothetical protein